MIKIDYSQYSDDELEDVWQQVDERNYPERAVSIYLAMKNRDIARFDNRPSPSTFEKELLAHFLYSRSRFNDDEEYQYQQRELAEKEKRVIAIIGTNKVGC